MSLWLITESAAQLDYFIANRVVPTSVILNLAEFSSRAPYLGRDADILVVVHGLTNFTAAGLKKFCEDLHQYKDFYKGVTFISDVKLDLPFPYYMYEGDLFEGKVYLVKKNKRYDLDEHGNVIKSKKVKPASFNCIMQRYSQYKTQDKDSVLGGQFIPTKPKDSVALQDKDMDDYLLKKLVCFEKN